MYASIIANKIVTNKCIDNILMKERGSFLNKLLPWLIINAVAKMLGTSNMPCGNKSNSSLGLNFIIHAIEVPNTNPF